MSASKRPKKLAARLLESDKIETKEDAPEAFNMEFVRCEICLQIIGRINMEHFDAPMTGAMFLSKDAKHGYPAPFHPSLTWRNLKCPYCGWRPFIHEHKFLNDKEEWCGYTIECDEPDCGAYFKSVYALSGHKGRQHGKG